MTKPHRRQVSPRPRTGTRWRGDRGGEGSLALSPPASLARKNPSAAPARRAGTLAQPRRAGPGDRDRRRRARGRRARRPLSTAHSEPGLSICRQPHCRAPAQPRPVGVATSLPVSSIGFRPKTVQRRCSREGFQVLLHNPRTGLAESKKFPLTLGCLGGPSGPTELQTSYPWITVQLYESTAGYKPVAIQTYPILGEKITQDTLYWNNYKTPVQIKEFGAVSKVDFSPQPPYNYAVTASSRIHIYGRYSQEPIKTFSRFKDTAYCATFRQDGRLLVAGSEDGGVQLFDISGRAPLRQFEGHTKAVHSVDLTADKYHVVSGADDYTVKLWDIPNSKEILTFKEHSDYVRCGCASKLNPDIFVTGSYDHTVKIFDARTNQSVISVEHGQPVESVLLFPSGGLLVSAGGRYVKVWDMLKGGQLLVSLKNHHKTVTCLCLSGSGQRLLSGSLDRKVKVYSTTSYKVVHSFDYTASILSLALAHEDETIVVGMTNGILSVKHRKSEAKKDSVHRRRRPAYRTFIKGKNYMKQQDDILINRPSKKHLELYDRDLKNFRISKALDRVLEPTCTIKTPEITVSIIKELNRRGVLANALAGRDEKEISRVLNFLIRNLSQPRFAPVLINAAEIIIDIYLPVIGQSPVVDKKFLILQGLVEKVIDYQRELLETLGMMDMLFATMTRKESTSVLQHNTSDGFLENNKMES